MSLCEAAAWLTLLSLWHVSQPKNAFSATRGLIRMSWDPRNLENLVARTQAPELARSSVFQQKWLSKRELRGYHVPNISEKQFLDRHFDTQMPNRQLTAKEKNEVPQYQALMFGELERRVDVVLFRSHFADSIWTARKMVVGGNVLVNGEKCIYPARRLNDGEMVTVRPRAIPTLGAATSPDKPRKFTPIPFMSPWMFIPAYLEVDYKTCSTVFLRSPVAQPNEMEIPSPLPPIFHQLVFEWYMRRKRAKKHSNRHPLIVCGQTVKLKPKFESIMRMDQKNAIADRRAKLAEQRRKVSEERYKEAEKYQQQSAV